MYCTTCHKELTPERAKLRSTCIECSTEQRAVGFNDYSHKTAPSLIIIPANSTEQLRRAERANRRCR